MRIGIVGNYGNDNQGDDAILEGILQQVEQALSIQRSQILVFSNHPAQTKARYGVRASRLFIRRSNDVATFFATLRHHRSIFRSLDFLIIGGGGILMDLYRNAPFVYGLYGLLARSQKVPTIIFGVGAGPIQTLPGKIIIKALANQAEYVTVRDMASKKRLEKLGVQRPIDVITDPAFFVPRAKNRKVELDNSLKIGVTAVPYYHERYWPTAKESVYQRYIQGMANNFNTLLAAYPKAKLHFFSTKHPVDTETTKEIKALLTDPSRAIVYDERLTFEDILTLLETFDLVIGTRLHSLILALVAQRPIIGVSYHPKVQDFMESIDCEELVFPIDTVGESDHLFLDRVKDLLRDEEKTRDRFYNIYQSLVSRFPNGADFIWKMQNLTKGD